MHNINLLWLLMLLMTSCEKDVITIIHEPEKVGADTVKPSSFEIIVDEVTDDHIKIHWTEAFDQTSNVSYDVLVNDSVISYGISSQRQYSIQNLVPDKEYSVSVMALDEERNSFTVTKMEITRKSFYNKILSFNPDYYFYRFDRVIATNDGGLLVCGRHLVNEYSIYVTFLMRLDLNFNIIWQKDYNSGIKDLRQISSGCFLITGSNSVFKIDSNGNELWRCPVRLESGELATAIENNSGQIMVVGYWWSIPAVNTEYYIAKVSATGTLMWEKHSAPTKHNHFLDIIQKQDGNYLVLGTHAINYLNNDWISSECLVETDDQGNITKEFDYYSNSQFNDQPTRIIRWGGNYLLTGSIIGCYPPFYTTKIVPRFILINPEGSIVWDKTADAIEANEYFSNYTVEEDNSILFLYLNGITWLNQNGEIMNKIALNELFQCMFVNKTSNGNFVLALPDGYVVEINKDGYRE